MLISSCSLDNKTGIWENENIITTKEDADLFREFKKLASAQVFFDKIIPISAGFKFEKPKQINNTEWTDVYYNMDNGDVVALVCTDWSIEISISDSFRVELITDEYADWLNNVVYK